jgi:glutamyl-tRNA reductase
MVAEVQDRIRAICRSELERFLHRSSLRDPRDREELEIMLSRIASKIAHPLISQMRHSPHDPMRQAAALDFIRRILGPQKNP